MAEKRKLPSDFHDVESAKRLDDLKQKTTLLNGNPYPDNFYVGQATDNGSCFFDSFRQGLEQQKEIQVTVEQLRNDCKEFTQKSPPGWFIRSIANSYDNNGQLRSETVDDYQAKIMNDNRWGNPGVEGRILCEEYDVKLHVIEDQSYFKYLQREVSQDKGGFSAEIQQAIMNSDSNEVLTQKLQEIRSNEARKLLENVIDHGDLGHIHSLISSSGSLSIDDLDYDDHTIHMVNGGDSHFEPLLDRNKSLAKQLQEEAKLKQEQEDHLLAKKLQVDEILEYCNLSKDISERAEVEKRFDELLKENPEGKIHDVIGQCVSDVAQRIKRSEEQNPSSLPRCSMKEPRVEVVSPQLVK